MFNYGKSKSEGQPQEKSSKKKEKEEQAIRQARDDQGKHREQLLEQCRYCPFTMISDEWLLIASHIKPGQLPHRKKRLILTMGIFFLLCLINYLIMDL